MAEFDLATIKNKEIHSKLQNLFKAPETKSGDLLTEEVFETKLEYASIFQPTTTAVEPTGVHDGMRLGDVYTKYGVLGNTLEIVPLVIWNSRNYYDRDRQEQVCRSPNAVTPIHNNLAEKCSECSFAKYSKGNPSKCTVSLNVLAAPVSLSYRPVIISFSRTSWRTGMDLVKQARISGDNIYDNVFTLKSGKAKDKAYYMYSIEGVSQTPKSLTPAIKLIHDQYLQVVKDSISYHENKNSGPGGNASIPDNIA